MLKLHFPNFLQLSVVYLGSLGRCHYYTHNDLVLEMLEYYPQKDMLHNNLGVIKHHDYTFHKTDCMVQMIQKYYY